MNSSYPLDNGWVVDQNNGSGVATTFQVYAVCSKYSTTTGYAVIAGPATDNPPGTDRAATAACPAGQSVLGGGIYSSSTSTADNINSTTPHTGSWSGFENNASTVDATIQAFAICAT